MMSKTRFLVPVIGLFACLTAIVGCGTTRLTNTTRGASEEMLLSHAIDRAVARLDLEVLAGQTVFLDTSNLGEISFSEYLTGAMRQHLLASGARLVSQPEQAQLVVEARAGSVATTQHERLVGIPQTTLPAIVFGVSGTLPEIAVIKETIHIGVAKVGVFAYRTDNGAGVWQSGMEANQSVSQSNWYLGLGPFHTGDVILDGNRDRRHLRNPSAQRAGHRSPLECERWVGELPSETRWLAAQASSDALQSDQERAVETIGPGFPELIDDPGLSSSDKTHPIQPVIIAPQ